MSRAGKPLPAGERLCRTLENAQNVALETARHHARDAYHALRRRFTDVDAAEAALQAAIASLYEARGYGNALFDIADQGLVKEIS